MSKKHKTPYESLREFIDDYIKIMEKINKDRLKAAEREVNHVQLECQAFNMLRQNITHLETHGVS